MWPEAHRKLSRRDLSDDRLPDTASCPSGPGRGAYTPSERITGFSPNEKAFSRARDDAVGSGSEVAGACAGKLALVTGASRGLGKAIAQRFAAEGATVGLTARTMEPDRKYDGSLRQTLDEIIGIGGSAIAIQADLSKPEDRERLFAEMVERVGAPDILVNNAAVTFLRPLDEFAERRVRLMIEMHVLAPMHLTQLVIPAMRERGRGWVLNITSVAGDLPEGPPFSEFDRAAGFGVYGTVKAALNRLTKSLAAELYDDGIAVNAAAPSNPVATPGAGTLDLAKTDTEDIELITQTALTLCTGDPKTLTGRIAHTQPFLREIGWLH
jgi:citronellol/citronellal dehydrogenase